MQHLTAFQLVVACLLCLLLSGVALLYPVKLQQKLVRPKSRSAALHSYPVKVGSADLDFTSLQFNYIKTNSFLKCEFKDGSWGKTELMRGEPFINLHIAATVLHYGQACFEGLKAFHGKDGKVRIFRPQENAKRLQESCNRILMEPFPQDRFVDACKELIRDNLAFVPPYESNGALYLRPVVFGSGPRMGLGPSMEYTLLILPIPAGDYYKGGPQAVDAVVVEDYDRAAARGVGNVKVGGNYAADLLPNMRAKKEGFPVALYLDSRTNTYVEEFSTSNFFGIDKNGAYVTPKSQAILGSVTNKSLMDLARSEGITVHQRQVPIEEVSTFKEVAACGTAVVVTPVKSITYQNKVIKIQDSKDMGPVTNLLYKKIRALQKGEIPDTFGWMVEI